LIANNETIGAWALGGGIFENNYYGSATIDNSTIVGNSVSGVVANYNQSGGGVSSFVPLTINNSPITDIMVDDSGGGVDSYRDLTVNNSIIAGNLSLRAGMADFDVGTSITSPNGHNIFGSDVLGNVAGDVENVAASAIFAAIDPATGGGLVNAAGVVPLRANVANPALGAADRFAIGSTDQIGTPRPSPSGTNPDIGAAESGFAHSKVASANNDTLTGTAAANTLGGLAGHNFLKGLGGADTLNGGEGGDFLEGGPATTGSTAASASTSPTMAISARL
jgi:hypothetical protein